MKFNSSLATFLEIDSEWTHTSNATSVNINKYLIAREGKSLVWEEKIVGAATKVADSRV